MTIVLTWNQVEEAIDQYVVRKFKTGITTRDLAMLDPQGNEIEGVSQVSVEVDEESPAATATGG